MTKRERGGSTEDAPENGTFRPRFTIPATYGFVRRWIDAQAKPSVSFVLVLRDWIERNGYIDVMNRPVEQLPRKGRPPGSVTSATGGDDDEDDAADTAPEARAEQSPDRGQAASSPAPVIRDEEDLVRSGQAQRVDLSPSDPATTFDPLDASVVPDERPAAPAAQPAPAVSSAGQSILDDLL